MRKQTNKQITNKATNPNTENSFDRTKPIAVGVCVCFFSILYSKYDERRFV